jgi:hypothetical protein
MGAPILNLLRAATVLNEEKKGAPNLDEKLFKVLRSSRQLGPTVIHKTKAYDQS